jgi:hypothetical protein
MRRSSRPTQHDGAMMAQTMGRWACTESVVSGRGVRPSGRARFMQTEASWK